MTTTKRDIVNRVVEKTDLDRKDVEMIVSKMFIVMSEGLLAQERIEIRGFGSWNVRLVQPHKARDPRTGKTVSVPERKKITGTPFIITTHGNDVLGAQKNKVHKKQILIWKY